MILCSALPIGRHRGSGRDARGGCGGGDAHARGSDHCRSRNYRGDDDCGHDHNCSRSCRGGGGHAGTCRGDCDAGTDAAAFSVRDRFHQFRAA